MCPRRWPASWPTSRRQKPDHIALTGDLVNVALPEEFRRAAAWLAAFDGPDRLTVIPGNHDVYVPIPWDQGLGLWGAYMAGDGQPPAAGFDVFPTLRRRDGVALIGLSTGVPKPPLLATGDLGPAQIARAEQLLAETGREGLCRIVLIHHPPLLDQSRFKHLTDAAAFQAMIRRVGCEAILHGHNHRSEIARIAGPQGPVPVLGVTSASAAPGSKYGRARYHLIRIERDGEGWTAQARDPGAQGRRQRLRAGRRPGVPQPCHARHGSLSRSWLLPTSSSRPSRANPI